MSPYQTQDHVIIYSWTLVVAQTNTPFPPTKARVQRTRKVSSMRLGVPNRVNCAVRNCHQFKTNQNYHGLILGKMLVKAIWNVFPSTLFHNPQSREIPKCMHFAGGFYIGLSASQGLGFSGVQKCGKYGPNKLPMRHLISHCTFAQHPAMLAASSSVGWAPCVVRASNPSWEISGCCPIDNLSHFA